MILANVNYMAETITIAAIKIARDIIEHINVTNSSSRNIEHTLIQILTKHIPQIENAMVEPLKGFMDPERLHEYKKKIQYSFTTDSREKIISYLHHHKEIKAQELVRTIEESIAIDIEHLESEMLKKVLGVAKQIKGTKIEAHRLPKNISHYAKKFQKAQTYKPDKRAG